MKKIISAQNILKQKGYVQNQFDTEGFMEAVAKFFMEHEVKDKLLLVPVRFLDVKPNKFYKNGQPMTYNSYGISVKNKDKGWADQAEDKNRKWVFAKDAWGEFSYLLEENPDDRRFYIDEPRIVIDKPFFKNAIFMLEVMGGYVVERDKKSRKSKYYVSLI